MISKTVGSGGDYATLADLFTAIYISYPDDITATVISDITESSSPFFSGKIGSTHTLTIVGNVNNNGVFGSGRKINLFSNMYIAPIGGNQGINFGSIIFDNLEFISNSNDYSFLIGASGGYDIFNITIKRCLFNRCALGPQGTIGGVASGARSIINCKFYMNRNTHCANVFAPSIGTALVENCSLYCTGVGETALLGGAGGGWGQPNYITVRNTVAVSTNGESFNITQGGIGVATVTYCASDGTCQSGVGNVSNIVPANEFVSLSDTHSKFLVPKSTSTFLKSSGTTPTLTSTDIAGNAIPDALGQYPIGCHVMLPLIISEYLWHFGDGDTSTEATPTHEYDTPGWYTVSLDVVYSDETTESYEKTDYIHVLAAPPVIIEQPEDQTVFAGQTATFTVEASGTEPLNYQWQKKPEGGFFSDIIGATSSSYTTPTTLYEDDSSEFRCVVTDVAGSATSDPATLTVIFQVVPDFVGVPRDGTAPLIVDFTNLTNIPDGYTASYLWNFGDGTTSLEENPTHTYLLRGSYTVTLNVPIIVFTIL